MTTKIKHIASNIITTAELDTSSLDSHFSGGTGVTYSSGAISIGQAVHPTDSPTFADLTITGNLNITGNIDQYNVTDLDVTDKTITLGSGQIEANSGGSGIIVDGSGAFIKWDESNTEWDFNAAIKVAGNVRSNNVQLFEGNTQTGGIFKEKSVTGSGTNTDTTIFTESGGGINFMVNGNVTKVVRVDSSGNVGIGATPTARLDVRRGDASGKIAEFHQNTGYGIDIGSSQSVAYISSGYNQRLDFKTDPTTGQTERMSILSNGNVGIGTTSPSDTLQVRGSDTTGDIRIGGGNGANNHRIYIHAHPTGAYIDSYGGSAYNALAIQASNLHLNSAAGTGNVGIGTTAPEYPLQVSGTNVLSGGGLATFAIYDTGTAYNGTNPGGGITFRGKYNSSAAITNFATVQGIKENATDGNYAAALRFTTRSNGSNLTERMRISSAGNVGIGTTSPNANLHVLSSGNGEIEVERASGALINIQAQSAKGIIGTDSNHDLGLKTNGGVRLTIDTSGNVGIGEPDPDSTLTVKGASHTNFQVKSNSGSTKAFIQTVQDTDVRIGSSTDHPVMLYTNGIQRMRINSDGNVNIGTAAVTGGRYFDIYNTGSTASDFAIARLITQQVGSSSTTSADIYKRKNGEFGFTNNDTNSAAYINFKIGTANVMRLKSNGNVGIGINNPATKLEVAGTVTWSGMSTSYVQHALNLNAIDDRDVAPEDLSYSDDFRIFFAEKNRIEGGTSGTTYMDFLYLNTYSDSSGGDTNALAFRKGAREIYHYQADQTATNWGTPKQLAYTDSNISGTSAGLTGSPDVAVGQITLSNVGNSAAYDTVLFDYNGYNGGTPEVTFKPASTPGSGVVNSYFRFANSNGTSTTSNNVANVTIAGKVGIGDDNPVTKLSVEKNTTITTGFNDISQFLDTTIGVGGSVSLNLGRANSTKNLGKMVFKYAGSGSNSNALNFGFYSADNLVTLLANGNFGIGTQGPTLPLDVSREVASSIGQTSTHTYTNNRNWAMRTNNYGSSNWGGWSLEQSTSQGGTPSVARIGVHLNGNVGINMGGDASTNLLEKNPATALHVGGDITVGSADSVGTGGTASIRFQNDNERSRITSNYATNGGGQMGFWTDTTGGSLLQRAYIKNDGSFNFNGPIKMHSNYWGSNDVMKAYRINGPSANSLTRTINVNTYWGFLAQGGAFMFMIHGWQSDAATGMVHWHNNGSNTQIITGVFLNEFHTASGLTVSVAKGTGAYDIDITLTSTHTNTHGWYWKVWA